MSALHTLALKVELTTEPHRELDAEVAVALRLGEYVERNERGTIEDHGYPRMIPPRDHWAADRKLGRYEWHQRSGISTRTAPEYTATEASRIEAAAALRAKAEELAAADRAAALKPFGEVAAIFDKAAGR